MEKYFKNWIRQFGKKLEFRKKIEIENLGEMENFHQICVYFETNFKKYLKQSYKE